MSSFDGVVGLRWIKIVEPVQNMIGCRQMLKKGKKMAISLPITNPTNATAVKSSENQALIFKEIFEKNCKFEKGKFIPKKYDIYLVFKK